MVDEGDVFVEFDKPKPGEELSHDFIFEVFDHSELLEISHVAYYVFLDVDVLVIFVVGDLERHFISVVVYVDKPIVQQEPAVTLLPIAIIHLLSSLDVFHGFNDEAFLLVGVAPGRLPGSLVVQHVCIGHETISFHSFNLDTKDSATHHHPDL